jgi:D-serine deaminase-like pyridoxal phosphate-dependent protein
LCFQHLSEVSAFLEGGNADLFSTPHADAYALTGSADSSIEAPCNAVNHGNVDGPSGPCLGRLDFCITNELTQPLKITSLLQLALSYRDKAYFTVLIDSLSNLRDILSQLDDVEQAVGGPCLSSAFSVLPLIGIFLEIDCGQSRCGLAPPTTDSGKTKIKAILSEIVDAEEKGLVTFRGLHVYQGGLQHVRSEEDREEAVKGSSIKVATLTRAFLQSEECMGLYGGVECQIITGGGTGTFQSEMAGLQHNEVQPGSYCFMDLDYAGNAKGNCDYKYACYHHTSVLSINVEDVENPRVVVDLGSKSTDLMSCSPQLTDPSVNSGFNQLLVPREVIQYTSGGDNHGILTGPGIKSLLLNEEQIVGGTGMGLKVGESLRAVFGHVDPTVNMYDYFVVYDENDEEGGGGGETEKVVADVWRIGGRGAGM